MSVTVTPYVFASRDRVDIRRFCGYPPYGTGTVVFPEPWVFRYYLALETRLNNLVPDEARVVLQYLTQLRTLEAAIPGSAANADTSSAAVWVRNPKELQERNALYRQWRLELCSVLGVPGGPHLNRASGVRLVV